MRTSVILATALLAIGATASPAGAAKPDRLPTPEGVETFNLCGGTLAVTIIKNNVKVKGGESGFSLSGNFAHELSLNGGPPLIVRTPGRLEVTVTEGTAVAENFGRTLLLPRDAVGVAAHEEAGLPEVALVAGRAIITSTLGEDGRSIDDDITYCGHVIDVCDLLR